METGRARRIVSFVCDALLVVITVALGLGVTRFIFLQL